MLLPNKQRQYRTLHIQQARLGRVLEGKDRGAAEVYPLTPDL
jgi:hypothetical protein